VNSHAHVTLELPAPKQVSFCGISTCLPRPSAKGCSVGHHNTPSCRCCPGYLLNSLLAIAQIYRYNNLVAICSWASRSARPRQVIPPDLLWILVAGRAIVELPSMYFSHVPLCSAHSYQYGARGGSTIGARIRFAYLALERGAMFSNRRSWLLLWLRADTRTAPGKTTGGGTTLNSMRNRSRLRLRPKCITGQPFDAGDRPMTKDSCGAASHPNPFAVLHQSTAGHLTEGSIPGI
jgi:hypothetical protein